MHIVQQVARQCDEEGLYGTAEVTLSAGGSAVFDLVARGLLDHRDEVMAGYRPDTAAPQFAHQAFQVEVLNPKGEKIYAEALTSDGYGGIAGKLDLPADATLTNDEAYDLVIAVATGELDDVGAIAAVLASGTTRRRAATY